VTKKFKKGDKVYGCTHGANFSNTEDGVFASSFNLRDGIGVLFGGQRVAVDTYATATVLTRI